VAEVLRGVQVGRARQGVGQGAGQGGGQGGGQGAVGGGQVKDCLGCGQILEVSTGKVSRGEMKIL